MHKLISVLKELSVQHDIKNYNWDIPQNCPIQIPDHLASNFDRNIYLKEHLNEALNKDDCLPAYYWMIQEWGGISSFKRNELNDAKILKFLKELEKNRSLKSLLIVFHLFLKLLLLLNQVNTLFMIQE